MTTKEIKNIIATCDAMLVAIQVTERDQSLPLAMRLAASGAFVTVLTLKANALRVQLKY